jgi:hypothetical protein
MRRRWSRPNRQAPAAEALRAELLRESTGKHDERRGPQ